MSHRLGALTAAGALAVAGLAGACGGSSGEPSGVGASTAPSAPSTAAAPSIVGQWMTEPSCPDMLAALRAAGLPGVAPSVLGVFFEENTTAQELSKKKDICAGAKPPVAHSHFFTAAGAFGSLDEQGQQVDDGTYVGTATRLFLCDSSVTPCSESKAKATFSYAVNGDDLTLSPLITNAQRGEAVNDPLQFHDAGWMIAVAYPGHSWHRTTCSRC